MKILISAAEASSDLHGAELLKALRAECAKSNEEVEAFGIGGPRLRGAGLRGIFDASDLLAMGSSEVLARLPKILRGLKALTEAARREKPDVAIVIDYPDFHFRAAERLSRLGIPLVYYIPPKVWVWRKRRIRLLARLFKRVLCIFPFEEEFYRNSGVAYRYIGNPLVDELPLNLTRAAARKLLGLSESEKVLTLMPGSRPSELSRHMRLMLDSVARLSADPAIGPLTVLVPLPEIADTQAARAEITKFSLECKTAQFRILQGQAAEALIASDAGIIKSGTSTLEAALVGCPHTVIYKASWVTTQFFFKVIRRKYKGPVALVNLVQGWRLGDPYIATELLGNAATVDAIVEDARSLLVDTPRRRAVVEALARLQKQMGVGDPSNRPSRKAALEILEVIRESKA